MEKKKCSNLDCNSGACWAITFDGHYSNNGDTNTYACGKHLHYHMASYAVIRNRQFVVKPIGKPRFVLANVGKIRRKNLQQYGMTF